MSNRANTSLTTTRISVVTFVLLCVWNLVLQPSSIVAVETSAKARASELVLQLGHEEFAMRERAAAELITLELDATAALRTGMKSRDREIQHRSARLLALISEIDLEHRFERFKKDTDPEQDYGLPGWDMYRKVAGDSPGAKSLFVSMHEDEPHLLGQIESHPNRVRDALENRCDRLRGQAMFERIQIRTGTTATLLFVATREGIEVSPLVQSVVYLACSGSSFESAIESGPLSDVLVTLTERWIDRQPAPGITDALHLGLTNGLKGCLPRARGVFESPVASVSDRIYACLCLAKFGDESDFPRLETYLEDVSICAQTPLEGQVVVTQIRDLALAGLVRLASQEPKDFGFDRLLVDRRFVFSLSSLGFRDEPSRVQAIEAWREYRRSMTEATAPP